MRSCGLAINSWASNASNAPSSNKQTFIQKIEQRYFERAPGKFFSWFCRVFRKDLLQFISTYLKKLFWPCWNMHCNIEVNVIHYLMSVALTSIENIGAAKQCFIEINPSSAECVTESNHAHVLSQYWFVFVWNSIKGTLLFRRKDGNNVN